MTTEINSVQGAQLSNGILGANAEIDEETRDDIEVLEPIMQSEDNIGLQSDIKKLANAVGISYQKEDTPEEILISISEELEAQIDDAEDNPQALSTLMGYYRQLNTLDARLDAIQFGESKIFDAMNLLSQNNRKEFGL